MTNQNELQTTYQTKLAKINDTYLPMISNQLEGYGIKFTDYQRTCVINALAEINNALETAGTAINKIDQQTLTQILQKVAALQLNASATPREVYFLTRKKKVGSDWDTQLEMGIEGDGNDSLLARFGRGVKTVHKFWEVREEDTFTYPRMKGLTMTDPEWEPTGKGKVVRIVYPVTKENGDIEYLIAEREDVVRNLTAHINNNMMNETFGIAKNRYQATDQQKKEIDVKKKELKEKMVGKSLDELLDDETFEKLISPAWKEPQSRESMIIRKMRNNVTKKYPKNFENAFLAMSYEEATSEDTRELRRDVTESANTTKFEAVETVEEEPEEAQKKPVIIDYDLETGEVSAPEESSEHNEPVQHTNENSADPF